MRHMVIQSRAFKHFHGGGLSCTGASSPREARMLEVPLRCAGGALTEEQRSWPECQIEELVLEGTRVTAASLPLLPHLSGLRFLDLRCAAPSLCPHQVQHARCWQCVACKSSSRLVVEVVTERTHNACRSHIQKTRLGSVGPPQAHPSAGPMHSFLHKSFWMSPSICSGVVLEPYRFTTLPSRSTWQSRQSAHSS
jgi:hypothetical protein